MQKKKVIAGIGIVLVAIALVSIYQFTRGQKENNIKIAPEDATHVAVSAKIDEYHSLKEIENKVDIIAKVVKDSEEPPMIWKNDLGNVYFVGTIGNVKVTKIYTNKSDRNIDVGDIIPVFENEAYDSETNTVYHVADYTKMTNNEEYILFLTYSPSDHWYVPCSAIWGKYPVNNSETVLYNYNSGAQSSEKEDLMKQIEQEVLDKYN